MPGNKKPRKKKSGVVKGKVKRVLLMGKLGITISNNTKRPTSPKRT